VSYANNQCFGYCMSYGRNCKRSINNLPDDGRRWCSKQQSIMNKVKPQIDTSTIDNHQLPIAHLRYKCMINVCKADINILHLQNPPPMGNNTKFREVPDVPSVRNRQNRQTLSVRNRSVTLRKVVVISTMPLSVIVNNSLLCQF
jgi:hypothetical protein